MLRTNERGKRARKEKPSSPHVYIAGSHLTLLAVYMMVNNLSISFDVIFRSLCELRTSNLRLNEDSITLVSVPWRLSLNVIAGLRPKVSQLFL